MCRLRLWYPNIEPFETSSNISKVADSFSYLVQSFQSETVLECLMLPDDLTNISKFYCVIYRQTQKDSLRPIS